MDEGIPVDLCLKKFSRWMHKLTSEKDVVCQGCTKDRPVNATCVTWSGMGELSCINELTHLGWC